MILASSTAPQEMSGQPGDHAVLLSRIWLFASSEVSLAIYIAYRVFVEPKSLVLIRSISARH